MAPAHDSRSCRCLKRRTQQSGEVQCDQGAHRDPAALAPATPFTGFLPRPNYRPPTVIVSHLLSGPTVEVMLFEKAPYEVLSVEDLPAASNQEVHLLAMEDFGFKD